MSYGVDNGRGIHAGSPSGDPSKMPDGFFASVGSLKAPGGFLGQPTEGQSRQDIPGSRDITPKEQYPFQSPGEAGLLGSDPNEGIHDDNYPALPNVALAGESGTTNMGQQGAPVNWNAVAPFEYPDFPKDSIKVGAPKGAVPLT